MTRDNSKAFLERKRGVSAGWLLSQTEELLDFAIKKKSANALVYAAFEARNSLERFVFEMPVLATRGKLSDKQIRSASRKDGLFDLLEECVPNYRSLMKFMNLTMEVMESPIRFPIPDIRSFRRLRTDLSEYCHCQFDPNETVDHPQDKWFIRGVSVIQRAIGLLKPLVTSPQGLPDHETMPIEVKELYDEYVKGTLTDSQVKKRLEIMQHVLQGRVEKHRIMS